MARNIEEIVKRALDNTKKVKDYSEIIRNMDKSKLPQYTKNAIGMNVRIPKTKIKISDVLEQFKPEELIEAMGIEKVQNYLRKKKIENIKK